ncbi:GAP family protein [Mycobacterium sp.]|uniref:GAP family protein n=1 Tax=Mycobacterium sp. TaxID=1785 RepID=UPI0011F8E365|nr:GAP family protein [Mycobacterium sp.]TAM67479.1 MAG: GAP family protein [Mycobacterium sp.]
MWGSVLGLGILAALNPVRLGLALLMISRPRPGPSLLAFWLGGLTVCVPELLVPLMLLNLTPMFRHMAHGSASPSTTSTLGKVQIGLGVIGLSIAVLMTVRFVTRRRAAQSAPDDRSAALSSASGAPIAIPRLLTRVQDVSRDDGSAFRRLLGRIHNAWDTGSSWVAWVIGLISVPVDGVLFIVAIIVASGASITAQFSAAIAFIVLMYAVVEVILVGYVATPAKTQSLLRVLHDWVRAYHRQILVTLFTVVGVSQLVQGLHIV